MKVSVKLLATYQKYLPPGSKGNIYTTDVAVGTDVMSLLARFGLPPGNATVVLVNGLMPKQPHILAENDVVCAFPAVGGG